MTQLVNDLADTGHVKEEVAGLAPIPQADNRYDGMLEILCQRRVLVLVLVISKSPHPVGSGVRGLVFKDDVYESPRRVRRLHVDRNYATPSILKPL